MTEYNNDGIADLAVAIVGQAEKDYCQAYRNRNKKAKREVEKFFLSGWGSTITHDNNKAILRKIKARAKNQAIRNLAEGWWTSEELKALEEMILNNFTVSQIAEKLNRSEPSVRTRAKRNYGTYSIERAKEAIERG